MTLNKLVKTQRHKLNLTQERLASMLGFVSGQVIYNVETGRMNVPKSKLKRLCRALLLDRSLVANILIKDYEEKVLKSLNLERK